MLPIIRCFRSPAPINFSILAKALTRKINGYLELVNSISRSYADKNIGPSKKIIGKSYPGVSTLQISNSILMDLHQLSSVFEDILN
jgi:hypothetical protein